jgi:hypothetical protein
MAESPSHKFGQLIGNLLEAVVEPYLSSFAKKKLLYLDHQKNPRKARKGKKVRWTDRHENIHDLDFVIEKDGTDDHMGTPVAFIEVAWRRYTKHSRNKAQEIQGAILPLAEKYQWSNPFLGVILSGVFTEGSLDQLRSLGFHILYFPYDTLIQSFAKEGIDIAFDETTPDLEFQKLVRIIESISSSKIEKIKDNLIRLNKTQMNTFFDALSKRLERLVERVALIPLYGNCREFGTIGDAVLFLDQHSTSEGSKDFQKYEIIVAFSNGDRVEGSFRDRNKVKEFLQFISMQ